MRILVRADSAFAREELMAWCETNGVHFLFGLAKNDRLIAEIKTELDQAAVQSRHTGKPARRFKDFRLTTAAGAAGAGSWRRRNGPKTRPIRASSSPRSRVPSARPAIFTKRSTAPAATWRTGSRSASSISMPIAPRPPPCGQISCACGSLRWPMCCCAPCAASGCITHRSPKRPAAPFVSSYSRSAPSYE